MKLCDKLLLLRKESGFSQEDLANKLGVSRQSVSKWEADLSMPEINKLIALADMFQVSLDYLLRDEITEYSKVEVSKDQELLKEQIKEISQYVKEKKGYEYKSNIKFGKIPLVHINFARGNRKYAVAKGIFAVGDAAIGVVSLGGFAAGILSFGGLGLGVLTIGGVAFGLFAIGGAAIGVCAVGFAALGIYSFGLSAVGKELAIGAAAAGNIAVGADAKGKHFLEVKTGIGFRADEIMSFIQQYGSNLPKFIIKLVQVFLHLFL